MLLYRAFKQQMFGAHGSYCGRQVQGPAGTPTYMTHVVVRGYCCCCCCDCVCTAVCSSGAGIVKVKL